MFVFFFNKKQAPRTSLGRGDVRAEIATRAAHGLYVWIREDGDLQLWVHLCPLGCRGTEEQTGLRWLISQGARLGTDPPFRRRIFPGGSRKRARSQLAPLADGSALSHLLGHPPGDGSTFSKTDLPGWELESLKVPSGAAGRSAARAPVLLPWAAARQRGRPPSSSGEWVAQRDTKRCAAMRRRRRANDTGGARG